MSWNLIFLLLGKSQIRRIKWIEDLFRGYSSSIIWKCVIKRWLPLSPKIFCWHSWTPWMQQTSEQMVFLISDLEFFWKPPLLPPRVLARDTASLSSTFSSSLYLMFYLRVFLILKAWIFFMFQIPSPAYFPFLQRLSVKNIPYNILRGGRDCQGFSWPHLHG